MTEASLERLQYEVLDQVRMQGGAEQPRVIGGLGIAEQLGISVEQLYFTIEQLTQEALLDYVGAGPKVRITQAGLHYLESVGRRRSVRPAPETDIGTPEENADSDR